MDRALLLSELRAAAATVPDFATYTPTSRNHAEWLGKAHALVNHWNQMEAISFRMAADQLSTERLRHGNIPKIINTLHRGIADLDLEVGALTGRAFGPGAVYDVMRALRDLLSAAQTEVLVVDAYMDAEVFDTYISAVATGVRIRLLLDKMASSLRPALAAFVMQHAVTLEARQSSKLHDRVIFLDKQSCYVLGQSIKDAAKKKATYLAPLSSEIASLKLAIYEDIWSSATAL